MTSNAERAFAPAPSSPQPAGHGASTGRPLDLAWLRPLGLVGLSIYNFVMRIVTLGIYHFWGKTEVRKRLWSAVRIDGEPLEYTGTGGELFRGFLIVFGLILLPVLLATFAVAVTFGPEFPVTNLFQVSLYVVFLFLMGIAIYRAQRYRMARTRWRGIRASLVGSSLRYGWTYFWTLFLLPLTLGWIAPWRAAKLQAMMTNDMRFGTMPFAFTGTSGPLYKPFTVLWVLTLGVMAAAGAAIFSAIPTELFSLDPESDTFKPPSPEQITRIVAIVYGTLFLVSIAYMILSAWYRAAMIRHFARHTRLDRMNFTSTVTPAGFIWIAISNLLILLLGAIVVTAITAGIAVALYTGLGNPADSPLAEQGARLGGVIGLIFLFSLGMLMPVAQARATGYLVRNMKMEGEVDTAAIAAAADQDIKRGEGLAQAFDIDAI